MLIQKCDRCRVDLPTISYMNMKEYKYTRADGAVVEIGAYCRVEGEDCDLCKKCLIDEITVAKEI